MNKINYIPTREDFFAYAIQQGWEDWAKELFVEMQRTHWVKNNGQPSKNWHSIVNARNGVVMSRLGKTKSDLKKYSRKKTVINEIQEEFPDSGLHYVVYTDGSCDNLSPFKAGGSAYIIIKDGEILIRKHHGRLNTTNNRMELLAIISAVKSCPEGAIH